jgi:hypothetical protein
MPCDSREESRLKTIFIYLGLFHTYTRNTFVAVIFTVGNVNSFAQSNVKCRGLHQ